MKPTAPSYPRTIRIGNVLARRHGVRPWCFGTADYRAALPSAAGAVLHGEPVDAVWDATLREAMERGGRAIHEEDVLDALLEDIGGSTDGRGVRTVPVTRRTW